MIEELAILLDGKVSMGKYLHVGNWVIFNGFMGDIVEVRNVWDDCERYSLGKQTDSPESIAAEFNLNLRGRA